MEVTEWFKQIIMIEKDIEAAKIELTLKHDFNLVDAFCLFDRQGLGCITQQDLAEGLRNNLDFHNFCADDILMMFHRADRKLLGRMTYKQFNDFILPFSQEYAYRVLDRREYYSRHNNDFRWFFNKETRLCFQTLWAVIFQGER